MGNLGIETIDTTSEPAAAPVVVEATAAMDVVEPASAPVVEQPLLVTPVKTRSRRGFLVGLGILAILLVASSSSAAYYGWAAYHNLGIIDHLNEQAAERQFEYEGEVEHRDQQIHELTKTVDERSKEINGLHANFSSAQSEISGLKVEVNLLRTLVNTPPTLLEIPAELYSKIRYAEAARVTIRKDAGIVAVMINKAQERLEAGASNSEGIIYAELGRLAISPSWGMFERNDMRVPAEFIGIDREILEAYDDIDLGLKRVIECLEAHCGSSNQIRSLIMPLFDGIAALINIADRLDLRAAQITDNSPIA